LSRAERIAFLLTLLGTPQEVSKKGAKTFPLGTPLAADAGLPRRGCLCGQRSGKDFCHPVLFEICANKGALQVAKIFAFSRCVLLPCWRFFIKTPTQNLNLLIFAKTLEAWNADSFCAHLGF
jgi:hypothetical protein